MVYKYAASKVSHVPVTPLIRLAREDTMKDPNDTRNIGPRPGSPLWIEMTAVTVVGAIVLVIASWKLHHLPDLASIPMFWVIALMIMAGEVWRIVTPGKSGPESPAASITISFAVLLYWGFPVAVLLRAIAVVAAGLIRRDSLHRTAFNVGQLSVSLGAAGLALAAAGVSPGPITPWRPDGGQLPVVAVAALAYFVVNFALVATAISLYSRTPVKRVVRANLRYQGFSHLVLFAAAPLMTAAMATSSARVVVLATIPIAAIYLNSASSAQRELQASHDELTGLCNRKLLTKQSTEALAKAAAEGTRAGFLLLDLDRSSGLKEVNDTLGHAVGDRLLQIVAHRLTNSVRPGDLVGRLGGDEFAVLLPSVKEATAAREVASRLRAALSEPVRLETMTFDLQASVGIAVYPDDAADFEQLMQRADVAMYLAKERRSGIERYVADADRNSADRLALVGELRRAVHRQEIELHFQPKVLLDGEHVIGMEALARWRHPQRGLLTAAEFVGLAEQSYLMSELTEQVISKALAQAAQWWADGLRIEVSVNLPARDLISARLVDLISRALRLHGLPPRALRLDISEQVVAGRSEQAAGTVRLLAELGVGVSLDDFGTGYSSLALLTRLGVSEVKLDPTLISGLSDCPDKIVTIRSLVNLASSLGIRSVAEGVETQAVASALRAIGCDGGQGWHFARPMGAVAATAWLADHYARRTVAAEPQAISQVELSVELTAVGTADQAEPAQGPALAATAPGG
jgi:diguanylate cyclase (GGDEF)-like protein